MFPDDRRELVLHLKLESFNGQPLPRNVLGVGLSKEVFSSLSTELGSRVTEVQRSAPGDPAAEMAVGILSGHCEPWINLRAGFGAQDSLRPVRRPLQYAFAAVSLCLISSCAAMLWRSARYNHLTARYADEQRDVFHATFPKQPEPLDVRSRLNSEERGLKGLSGDSTIAPPQARGLIVLRDLLAKLPQDVRFRVLELRLDGSRFALDGQVRISRRCRRDCQLSASRWCVCSRSTAH